MFETVTASIVDPNGGGTTIDPLTQLPVITPGTPIVVTNATFNQLTSTELVARSQLQDDSKYKLRIDYNALNKTIDNTFEATVDSKVYRINGEPKKPIMGQGRITLYLSKK